MLPILRTLAVALVPLCLPAAAFAQTVFYGPSIGLEAARKAAGGAAAEARKQNFTMAIAVVDTGGRLVYFERMDGTQIASSDVALAKAVSANGYKRSTKVFEDAVAGGRNAILALPGAMPIEGGLPIMVDGKIVGAIGVSGGTAPQDGQVAAAGLAVLQPPK